MNTRRVLSGIWRGMKAVGRFAKRKPKTAMGIVIFLLLMYICQITSQLNKMTFSQQQSPRVVQQGQSVSQPTEVVLPTLPPSSVVPVGQYDAFMTGTIQNPKGALAYVSAQTCMNGCGSYKGILVLRGIRVVDNSTFVVDIDINITEAFGDPWLFQGDLSDIQFEVNGQIYKAVASSFSSKVTGVATFSGYLTFVGQIPLADPANPQYKVVLRMPTRAQPIEGWLSPHK